MPAVTAYLNQSKVNFIKRQKFAGIIKSLSLLIAIALHLGLALLLLSPIKNELIKQPVLIEVQMFSVATTNNQSLDKVLPAKKIEPAIAKPIEKKPKSIPIKKSAVIIPPTPLPSQELIETVPEVKAVPESVVSQEEKTVAQSTEAITKKTDPSIQAHDADEKSVNSGIMPLVKVNPVYPNRAASRGIEGWVKIEFTILPNGTVADAIVVQAMPEAVFDDAALAAIEQWQFKPKMDNGVAVSQRAAQQLQFKLNR